MTGASEDFAQYILLKKNLPELAAKAQSKYRLPISHGYSSVRPQNKYNTY
jgi:hypothetical protein